MIILASASPRRQELLKLICDSFTIEPADIDETVNVDIQLDKIPEYLATEKARYIHTNNHYNDIVIQIFKKELKIKSQVLIILTI